MSETDLPIGDVATVTNPRHPDSTWTGKLIGYRDHPCVTLELDGGERMCLPADWMVRDDV